ncbi:MAG: hexokinase [Spirochaetales bacterium]|nr:hexokinase [Spirochaetales bacterium]
MNNKQRAVEFLRSHGMDPADMDLEACVETFMEEMRRGLAGQPSSLEMIPTYIDLVEELPVGRKVIALDAGGTHLRVATVHFDERLQPVIENFERYTMPGVEREVGKEEFFRTFADYLAPVAEASERIGFCFSYSMDKTPSKDGRLNRFSKEIKAPEVIGELVGDSILRALAARGSGGSGGAGAALSRGAGKRIVLLNDTVATMVAGKATSAGRSYSGYMGFILGTGSNTCYTESNRNITTRKDLDPTGTQIINTESGNYALPPRGRLDEEFAAATRKPREGIIEKMYSGAYLGPLTLRVLRRAAADGLLGPGAGEGLGALAELATEDLHELLVHPLSTTHPLGSALAGASETDRELACFLVDRLIERAAKLATIVLSGCLLKSGAGHSPCAPVCVVVEGSMFYGLKALRPRIEFYLKGYLEDRQDRYCEIVKVENASLIGAAIAGLTN